MASLKTKRESFYFYNNLVCLVKAIENQYTTIDLHNEECVTGKVVLVDAFMNIELHDAVFYNARGQEIPFKSFFVRARCVRYVHIPISIPIFETIKKSVTGPPKKNKRKQTYREKRNERRQKETLTYLHKQR